jgi:hypothetical protein
LNRLRTRFGHFWMFAKIHSACVFFFWIMITYSTLRKNHKASNMAWPTRRPVASSCCVSRRYLGRYGWRCAPCSESKQRCRSNSGLHVPHFHIRRGLLRRTKNHVVCQGFANMLFRHDLNRRKDMPRVRFVVSATNSHRVHFLTKKHFAHRSLQYRSLPVGYR